jgi:CubicO group peptidase (beta-lactamase class C family)
MIGIVVISLAARLGAAGSDNASSVVETGSACEALAPFDELMRSFLRDNEIPGGALAVARQGRLVYARGFGYADAPQKLPVQPDALFRIASISKPITAVAVLQLIDAGKCGLDDPVFPLLPDLVPLSDGGGVDGRLKEITIRHLLQHRGGWDRDVSIDPMFHSVAIASGLGVAAPAGPPEIIRFMATWPLDFDPGTRYAYSNFGYCVLGRVIERMTGVTYEEHVRAALLEPLGIRRMRMGRTLADERAEGEVRYHLPQGETGLAAVGHPQARRVPRPYGAWYLEAMDAHGGWIASAIDLVRFASRVATDAEPHVLSPESRAAMIARPPGPEELDEDGKPRTRYYGLGWSARPVGDDGRVNLSHMGLLDGTSTLLVIRHDGLCWAAVFNTSRSSDGSAPASKIDPLLHEAADAVQSWPESDAFPDWLAPR